MQTVDRGYRVRRFDGSAWSEPGGQLYTDTGAATFGLRLGALPDGQVFAAWESDGTIALRTRQGDGWAQLPPPQLSFDTRWPAGLLPSADGSLLLFAGAAQTIDGAEVYRWQTLERTATGWQALGDFSAANYLIRGGPKLLRLELTASTTGAATDVRAETWIGGAWVNTHQTTVPVPPDAKLRAASNGDAVYLAYEQRNGEGEVRIALTHFDGTAWSAPVVVTDAGKVAVLHSLRVSDTEGPTLLIQRGGVGSELELLFWDGVTFEQGPLFAAYPPRRHLTDARLIRTLDGSLSAVWREAPEALVASDGSGMTRIFIARF